MADCGDADARGRDRPASAVLDLVDHELLTIAGVGVFRLEPGGIADWTTPLPIHPRLDPQAMLCPRHFIAACHPDDVNPVIDQLQAARRAGGHGAYDYRLRTTDGRWRTFRTIYRSEPSGEGFTIIGLVQDITELADARDAALRVEQQVRGLMEESRVNARRLKLALGAAQAGVFELDHEAETFWCSPELVLLIGRQMGFEEANALPWDCVHKDDRPAVIEAAKTWMTGALLNAPLDVRVVRPDGQVRWVRLYYELKRDVRGRARRSVGLMLDIDERKRQELALVEAEKAAQSGAEAKSRFLASVSHEIRTPLNGVLGVLHLLKAERLTDDGRRLIDEALACGKMLSELINDVLDFSKIEANQLELAPEPTDPVETLSGVAALLEPQCEAKGLYLKLEPEPGLGWAMVDPIRLRQALFNLLGNAVKFTLSGGIRVRLKAFDGANGRRLRFEIEDTGIGVPEEAREHLFERFQQADGSTTRRFGGTGLGLAITRRLAVLMDGEVGFESTVGVGSTFWLDIAAPAAEKPADRPDAFEGIRLEGLKVLVVEDNPTNRVIATRILENLGAEVRTANDGRQGVDAAAGGEFDLILMDVQMPVMDGVEAARCIRALPEPVCRTPIVALTANVMSHQREAYLAEGMDGVVAKPISPLALMTEIARLASDEPELSEAAA